MATTADQFLAQLERRLGFDPAPTYESADLLALADEEIVGAMMPIVIKARGARYLHALDHDITSGYSRYALPHNAYGPIKDILLVTDTHPEGVSLAVVDIEELGHIDKAAVGQYLAYIDGDFVGLYPEPTTTQHTLRIRYYRHPNKLCLAAAAVEITGDVDLDLGDIGADADPLWDVGDVLDVISHRNSHQVLAERLTIDELVFQGVSFEEDISGTGIQTGDYLADTGFTPLVPLPDELVPVLVSRVKMAVLDGLGDGAAFVRAAATTGELERRGASAITPRQEAEPMVIVPRGSALRAGRWRGR